MHALNSAPTGEVLTLSGFLHSLFDGLEGYAYCPTLDRETGQFKRVFVKVPNQIERLERYIREESEKTDVYLAPAVFSAPKATKECFKASNVLWCEFDGNAPTVLDPEPSIRVKSSITGHEHHYYKLDETVDDAFILEGLNRGLTFTLGADKSGWDCTQILRPPESFNHKRQATVTVVSSTDQIFNVGDFSKYKAPDRLDEDSIKLGSVPDVMDVIYSYALGTEFKDIFTSKPKEGTRSTYMMQVGYLSAEAGVSNEEMYALLFNADDRWGKYKDREDRHRRLVDIIERVRIKFPLKGSESVDTEPIEIYDIISFGNAVKAPDWLLPSLLQQQGNMLVSGPPGVGKTQFALNFAYGLTTGSDVLGYAPPSPQKILFISAEMGGPDLKVFTDQMLRQYTEDQHELLRNNFFVLPLGEPMYLNTSKEQDKLCRLTEALKLDGIIFDSLGSALSKPLTDEEAVKSFMTFNEKFRNYFGAFTWYIHHNRKGNDTNRNPSELQDVYGSMYIAARATTILTLWPVQPNVLRVKEVKIRLAPQGPDWYVKRTSNLGFTRIAEDAIATVITNKESNDKSTNRGNGRGTSGNPYGI